MTFEEKLTELCSRYITERELDDSFKEEIREIAKKIQKSSVENAVPKRTESSKVNEIISCPCCGQSTDYLLPIDIGTVYILKQMARFIGRKGINVVHPRKEMEGGYLSSNQVGNLSRPRAHGLIAKVKGNPGNYCLTTKGGQFLRGLAIPKYAIRSKTDKHTVGYYKPDTETVTINQIQKKGVMPEYWEGINYQIVEGRVVRDL